MLLEPLIEETPLLYRKGKRRAITGFEIAEERERDTSRQRCYNERPAAALAAADEALAVQEEEKLAEERMVEAVWVADTQLQLSQLSCLDADLHKDQRRQSSSSLEALVDAADSMGQAGLSSQAQPVEISSSDESSDS